MFRWVLNTPLSVDTNLEAIRAGCNSARTLKIKPRGSAVKLGTISKKKISAEANPKRFIATPNLHAETVNAEIG